MRTFPKTVQEALDSLEEIFSRRHPDSFQVFAAGEAGGVTATVNAVSGKSHYLTDLIAWSDSASRVEIWEGTAATKTVISEIFMTPYAKRICFFISYSAQSA